MLYYGVKAQSGRSCASSGTVMKKEGTSDERGTDLCRNEFRRFLRARDHGGKRVIESLRIPVNSFRECLLRAVAIRRGDKCGRICKSFSARE